MDIKCAVCGKDVSPLELYDGFIACPICKNFLDDKFGRFVITKDNDELFNQAEILYAGWLFNKNGKTGLADVQRAINLCRTSANMGNPKALARLAYFYDKKYIGELTSETMRVKMAYAYYSAICFSGLTGIETEKGAKRVEWLDMREQVALAMLDMLSTAPAELRQSPAYNLKDNLDRVQNELGVAMNYKPRSFGEEATTISARSFDVLVSTVSKQRAPLFGAFRLRIDELIELYRRPFPGKETKIPSAIYWLTTNKKLLLAYIDSNKIDVSDELFKRLSTQRSVEAMIREHADSDTVWIFFFNHNGAHKYLGSARKREKVLDKIFGRTGTGLLKNMLQNGNQKQYVFYDDDIYFFTKQNNFADATRALVDKVCNGDEA